MRPTHRNSAESQAIRNEKMRRKMLVGKERCSEERGWESVGKGLIAEESEHCSFSWQMTASVPSSHK